MIQGADAAEYDAPITIPTRWLNNIVSVFLYPLAWILTAAFFSCFHNATVHHAFWATEEFWFFSLGAVLWALAFAGSIWVFGEPRPLSVYVFGHELTHAIWAKAMGGRIFDFRASRDGGYVLTDKSNFLIALSPYFHPLYSIVVIAAYGIASQFYDLKYYTPILFGLLGFTWSFHFCFTIWMILKGQTDLSSQGYPFSFVVIYLFNLVTLVGLLIFAAPEVRLIDFWNEFVRYAGDFSEAVLVLFNAGVRALLNRLG